jgi:hypothetical protein
LGVTTLVRSGQPDDDNLEELGSRAADLEAMLRERATEIDRVKSALAAFKVSYRERVGLLHEELDELERAIADAELDGWSARAEGSGRHQTGSPAGAQRGEPAPRYTSDAVRRLFRDVAKAIHPDLARDEFTRDRRHALMVEANRAYASGDEERLRWILQAWEKSAEVMHGNDPETTRLRLVHRIAEMEEQAESLAADLAALKESPVWKMKAMVDEAAAKGKDLVREMVGRLKRDIMVARNRLDAIQARP